ncbi:MAG: C69 family dipeptidase [Pyramidobacter sp.]|jgi:dipeptidase
MTVLLLAFALVLLTSVYARACTTVVIGREASSTGHVIVGHNEDDGGRIINRHGYVPAADHDDGEMLPAEKGCASIPQVKHTLGFYWSEAKEAKGGMSTSDSFYNERGVLIVSNSCCDSKENIEDGSRLSEGGIGFNLRRILAERAESARDAVRIAAELLSRYGYVSSGRTYTLADADEAWLMAVVSGKHFAARRVGDKEAAFIPNYYTIHDVDPDDRENFVVSPDLLDYAKAKGWYDPATGPFDFAKAYQSDETLNATGNRYRSAGGYSVLSRSRFWRRDGECYPFSILPRAPVSANQVKEALRCHYDGSFLDPDWARCAFPGGAPHDTEIRRICTGTTIEASVTVFGERSRPQATVMWLSCGRPCELPFLPIHPWFGVPAALDTMGNEAPKMLEEHLLPDAELASWHDNGWQRMRDFQSLFELLWQEHEAAHSRWLWSFEAELAHRGAKLQRRLESEDVTEDLEKQVRQCDDLTAESAAAALAAMEKDLAPVPVRAVPDRAAMDAEGNVTLVFELGEGRVPMESSLLAVLGSTNARLKGIKAVEGSLKSFGNRWSFAVPAAELQKADVPGTFDYWLGGRDTYGRSFGGRFFFTVTAEK